MSFYFVVILLVLLTVSTYTWFSLSQTPRVSDMYMFVNTETGLEIAMNPSGEWTQQLDFRNMVDVTTPLRPVTWSNKDQCFYAASYMPDGRMTGEWKALTDEANANQLSLAGYYIKATIYARSGVSLDVYLSPAVEVDEGLQGSGTYVIGYPVWDEEAVMHKNGGLGGESAIRIGIRITPVNAAGVPTGREPKFYIYEPNCNVHMDAVAGYVPTPSIDGTETLVDEEMMILQSQSYWTEAYPVEHNVVMHQLGEFLEEPKLFSLNAGEMVRMDLYIWLEGQDIDCTNEISKAQIMANLQFGAGDQSQSGMQPIY